MHVRSLQSLAAACLVACPLAASSVAAQATVSGVATDSTGAGLPAATVALLARPDSALVGFAATRADGAFELRRVAPGAYLVQVSFVGFEPATVPVEVSGEPVDVGRVRLAPQAEALGALVVRADRVPVVLRRDTLDFDAGAFRTPPGASVEDLLRQMPGVEVQRDGSIRAQGEAVDRVLVDGREFFGDDPTVATRNLPADAVDRVQIYDRASETVAFTGVDDGDAERTINLSLRPDRRTGQFGTLRGAGGGGDGARFDGEASVHRFSASSQLSVLGTVNNVNRQAFGLDDVIAFLGGLSALSAGGRLEIPEGLPIGDGPSDGFATTASGGLNLGRDLGAATELQSSYFGARIETVRDRQTRRLGLLGAGAQSVTEARTDQAGGTDAHRLDASILHAFGDGHDLRLRTGFRAFGTTSLADGVRRTTGPSGVVEADRTTRSAADATRLGGDAALTYRRRLGARSVVARASARLEREAEDRAFSASADASGLGLGDDARAERERSAQGELDLLLTQPLGAGRALQLGLAHHVTGELAEWTHAEADPSDRVALDRTAQVSRAGLTLRDTRARHAASLGLHAERTALGGALPSRFGAPRRRPLRLLPSASLWLSPSPSRTVALRYQATTAEPDLSLLQPTADPRGALDVFVGNAALEPETAHVASARYVHFDAFTLASAHAVLSATVTTHAISTARTTDSTLRQTRTPINAGTAWRVDASGGYSAPIRRWRTTASATGSASVDRRTERIDGRDNAAAVTRATLDLSVENQRKVWADVRVGVRLALTDARYALSPAFDRRALRRAVYAEASAELGRSWRLGVQADHEVVTSGVFGAEQRLPRLGAEVSRAVGARTRLELSARDLLNQGLAVHYDATPASVQEERVRSLGRHVLLRLTVDLSPVRR